MLINGASLGLVWGLVVRYLEGRRTSDILLSALACSFIIAGGVFPDVGRAVMAGEPIPMLGVNLPNPLAACSEFWMPAATGLLFAIPFVLALWLLNQVPEPNQLDVTERTEREPMDSSRRRELCQVASVHSLIDSHYRILVWFSSWKFRSRNPVIRTEGKFSW